MKVYVVMGGMNYGGFSPWTMLTFKTQEAAESHAHQITAGGIVDREDVEISVYDFAKVFEQEVIK